MSSKLTRRGFLKALTTGTCGALVHQAIMPYEKMMAYATPLSAMAGPLEALFIVNLAGGCSYNITPPYNGEYYAKNPNVSYTPEQSLALAPEQGLHPALQALPQIYSEGNLAVLNLVGYPNPNRSHDESTRIWHAGTRSVSNSMGGWGARLTCQMNSSIFNGVSLAGANTFIQGDCNAPRAFGDLNNFGEHGFWGGRNGTDWLRWSREDMIHQANPTANDRQEFVKESMVNLQRSLETVRRETNITLPVAFPNTGFGNACRNAARLIAARSLNTRLLYAELGGFDTHAMERPRLNQLLTELNGGLAAFIQCMKALGRWQNVAVITMSEFSRTFENGSEGTDHGHAGPMLVMGGGVKGGIKSPAPTGAETAAADGYYHNYHVDFREPFAAAVRAMGLEPSSVFPEAFNPRNLDLF